MTVVGILGVNHDEEMRNKYNLTLDLIKELILDFNPNVICGEVTPATWDLYSQGKANQGYWAESDQTYKAYWAEPASEYWTLIFPLCKEYNIEFVPVDWLELDIWWDFEPSAKLSPEQKEQFESELSQWDEKQLALCSQSTIPFNSFALDEVTMAKYEWLRQINPDAHIFRWTNRHLIMIQRIKRAINKFEGKRILCIAGADHNPYFYDSLKDENVELVYPLR